MGLSAKLSALCAQRLVYAVHDLDGSELVIEDVGPGVAPLFCGIFDLAKSTLSRRAGLGLETVPLAGRRWSGMAVVEVSWAGSGWVMGRLGGATKGSTPPVPCRLLQPQARSSQRKTHPLQHLVGIVEIAEHGLDIGFIG